MQIDEFEQAQDAAGRRKAPLLPVAKRGYGGCSSRRELSLRQTGSRARLPKQNLLGRGHAPDAGFRLVEGGAKLDERHARIGLDGFGYFFNIHLKHPNQYPLVKPWRGSPWCTS